VQIKQIGPAHLQGSPEGGFPRAEKQGRLMIVISELTVGGADTQAVRLAEEFKGRGWQVCVVCLSDCAAAVGNRVRDREIEMCPLGKRRGLPDPSAIARLCRVVETFQPTIVHSHMFQANLLCRMARLFCNMPKLVCTVYNPREICGRGGPTWPKQVLNRATARLADRTTVVCNSGLELFHEAEAAPNGELQVIPHGVDPEFFSASDAQKSAARSELCLGNEFAWLAVGRMVKHKDYGNLFDALEQLGTSEFALFVLGDGPFEPQLRARRDQSFFKNKIDFCGQRTNRLPFYRAADGFVMSSRSEGLPIALLEAASAGLPAVVTDVGGNGDVVISGETGYLVPPRNPAQLAAAMRKLMDTPADRRRLLGEAARQHINEHFRFPLIAEKWLSVYCDLPEETILSDEEDTSVAKVDFATAK
jgi:glycosyltransferase involved in cell wall biosynthesis